MRLATLVQKLWRSCLSSHQHLHSSGSAPADEQYQEEQEMACCCTWDVHSNNITNIGASALADALAQPGCSLQVPFCDRCNMCVSAMYYSRLSLLEWCATHAWELGSHQFLCCE